MFLNFVSLPNMKEFIKPEDINKEVLILIHYENYVLNVLNLYSSLCRGRNYKSKEALRKYCNINEYFIKKGLDFFTNN